MESGSGFTERITQYPISGPDQLEFTGNVLKVSITCLPNSTYPLIIGWNANAQSTNFLLPGQSKPYVAQLGNTLDFNKLNVAFATLDGTDLDDTQFVGALIEITYRDKKIC